MGARCSFCAEPAGARNPDKMGPHAERARRFAAGSRLFAAAGAAKLAPPAQGLRAHRKAGFFRVCFATALNYANFEPWKSSFAK